MHDKKHSYQNRIGDVHGARNVCGTSSWGIISPGPRVFKHTSKPRKRSRALRNEECRIERASIIGFIERSKQWEPGDIIPKPTHGIRGTNTSWNLLYVKPFLNRNPNHFRVVEVPWRVGVCLCWSMSRKLGIAFANSCVCRNPSLFPRCCDVLV